MIWHTVFMLMTVIVVARGVRRGLERAVTLLMPALFVMLLIMVGYAYVEGDFEQRLRFSVRRRFLQGVPAVYRELPRNCSASFTVSRCWSPWVMPFSP